MSLSAAANLSLAQRRSRSPPERDAGGGLPPVRLASETVWAADAGTGPVVVPAVPSYRLGRPGLSFAPPNL